MIIYVVQDFHGLDKIAILDYRMDPDGMIQVVESLGTLDLEEPAAFMVWFSSRPRFWQVECAVLGNHPAPNIFIVRDLEVEPS
jgi:hypothetical protein